MICLTDGPPYARVLRQEGTLGLSLLPRCLALHIQQRAEQKVAMDGSLRAHQTAARNKLTKSRVNVGEVRCPGSTAAPAALAAEPAVAPSAKRRASLRGLPADPSPPSEPSAPSGSFSAAATSAAKAAGGCRRREGRRDAEGAAAGAAEASMLAAAAQWVPSSERVEHWRRAWTTLGGSSKSGSPVSCRGYGTAQVEGPAHELRKP